MYTFKYGKKLLKGKDSLEKMEDGIFLHFYIMNLSGKTQKIVGFIDPPNMDNISIKTSNNDCNEA